MHPNEARATGENGFEWAKSRFTIERYPENILNGLKEALSES